jgi:hypothetical protein
VTELALVDVNDRMCAALETPALAGRPRSNVHHMLIDVSMEFVEDKFPDGWRFAPNSTAGHGEEVS